MLVTEWKSADNVLSNMPKTKDDDKASKNVIHTLFQCLFLA